MKNSQGWQILLSGLGGSPSFKRKLDLMGVSNETTNELKVIRPKTGTEVVSEFPRDFEQFDVLYIDDDLASLSLVCVFFWIYGINCQGVQYGGAGFKKLEQHIPYLLIIDTILPDYRGWEICQLIRKNPKMKESIILFLSINPFQYIDKYRDYSDGCLWAPSDFKALKLIVLLIKKLKEGKVWQK